ncbi:hypothetical protein KIS4809_2039 [Bacillus sp. ZZV12-4809]|nr:hypothetical protein KIS4809_2039 [Bacillus sp. ZZV12-4809]
MKGGRKMFKKKIVPILVLLLLIAGVLDLKFEGLFFQLLPESIQAKVVQLF